MKRLNRFILLALVYPFAVARVLGRRLKRATRIQRRKIIATGMAVVAALGIFAATSANAGNELGYNSAVDYSLTFDGTNPIQVLDSGTVPTDFTTNFTMEAWIKPGTCTAGRCMIANKEESWEWSVYNGAIEYAITTNAGGWAWVATNALVPSNSWSHVAWVKSGTAMKFYVNGALADDSRTTGQTTIVSNLAFTIGGREGTADRYIGAMDEHKLWNTDRTQAQILVDMHNYGDGVGPNFLDDPSLVGYYDFNEGPNAGAQIYDRTTPSQHVAVVSGATKPTYSDIKTRAVLGGDTVYTFPRSYITPVGGWTAPTGATRARVLVIAGGGAGGPGQSSGWNGPGGGAGGMRDIPTASTSGVMKVTVGQGGFAAPTNAAFSSTSGQDSFFGAESSVGGGGGNHYGFPGLGQNGGSGSGAMMFGGWSTSTSAAGGTGIAGQGNAGGRNASASVSNVHYASGGGGGAGSAGGNASGQTGGAAGSGALSNISGVDKYYAGGGAGAGSATQGAANTTYAATLVGTTPTANTGSGGAGGRNAGTEPTPGASGVVVVRYSPQVDLAWDKGNLDGEYAFLNNTSDPVIPTASNAAWTVEAWVRPDSFSTTWTNLFGQQVNADPYSGRNSIWLSNGQVVLAGPAGIDSNTGYFLPLNRWTHVAWVMTTTASSQLYVDGNLVWDGSVTRGTGGTHFAIGGSRQTGYVSFDGNIDQFKVWGVNLTATQVANSMHAHGSTFTGAPAASCATGMRAHYDFNEFIAGTVSDRSGCGRHLAFNTAVAGSYAESNFTSSAIIETGTAFSATQNVVKFNRSYLTATGGWTPPTGITRYKAVVVAGGGGGGAWVGGGGGGGGLSQSQRVDLTQAAIAVQVGQGGGGAKWGVSNAGAASYSQYASSGQNSSLGTTLTATGGGYGGSHRPGTSGDSWITLARAKPAIGGSGGGGSGKETGAGDWTTIATGAAGTPGQGNNGGSGTSGGWQAAGGGGAGAAGSPGVTGAAGAGGAGLNVNITGTSLTLAGGGGGANHENPTQTANGGSGGGGRGGNIHALDGSANTGGGGGGGGNNSTAGNTSSGGEGGSGVVILSYGAYMGVAQEPGGARAGTAFARPITVQLKNADGTNNAASGVSVTLSAASASVLQQTVGTTTSNVTSVNATSNANGLVTFTGLGFQSGVGTSAQTLTFTADAFVGTTLSVAPTFVSTSVTVSSTATTNGQFINGVFQATTAAATNILASDLITALASSNVLVESAGNISVSTGLTSTATNNLSLTCAGTGAFANVGGAISLASDLSVSCATVTTSAAVETTGTGGVSLTSLTGAMSIGAAISSATDLLVESATTTALNANLNAGSQGILVKSAGRITGSAGTSALVPRLIRTASGPITLWTTGATGGVQLGNFTQLNSTNSGVGGDITIGGGVATAADPARPSGFAQSSAAAGIALGTTATASGVVMVAGSGNISLSGEHTSIGANSGVDIFPGVDLVGNQVSIRGTSGHNLTTGGSGVSAYVSSTIKSLIHATGSFVSATTALQIESSSASSTGALLGPSTAATDSLTFRASGNNAGISIKGTTSKASSVGLWLASATLEVKNGPTVLDSGDDTITIGKDSGRVFTYRPVNGGAGGDITVNTAGLADSINISLQTAGTVSLIPSSTSFASAVAFPTAGSSFSVGGLVVGSTTNTADLTVGAAVTSAGDVTYRGGSNTVSANVSSTAGSVAFYSTGASKTFSKTTATITAFKDVVISSAASTVSTGSGAISAGTVGLSSSSTMTSGAPITSSGIVEISSSAGDTTVSGINNIAANLTISGGAVSVTAAQTTTGSGNIIITPRAGYSGAGALTSGTTLSITGGTGISPTANFSAAGDVTLTGSGTIYLSDADVISLGGAVTMTAGPVTGHGVQVRASTISSTTKPIQINSSSSGIALYLYEGSVISTTLGAIDINAMATAERAIYAVGASKISSTSGDIDISGSSVPGHWSIWLETMGILSNEGDIRIDSGARGIVTGYANGTTIGATSSGSASGDITVLGDTYWDSSGIVDYKTTGNVVIESIASQFISGSFNNHTFTNHASLRLGRSTNQTAVTLNGGAINITGDYTVHGSAVAQNVSVISSAGNILIDPTTTYVGSGALTAALGTVTISSGTSIAPTGEIQAKGNVVLRGSGDISTASTKNTGSSHGSVEFTSTAGSITFGGPVSAFGALSATGVNVTANQNLTTTASGTSPLLLKAENYLVVADSRTLQTNGSNLVLWASSKGGFGYIAIRNSVCINTNASCDVNVATSTGNIYLGGGTAGTDYPTGPVLDNSWRGIRLGESGSGVKLLSGGGDISIDGQSSSYYGVEIYQGVVIKATTGSVSITGRSMATNYQALRIAGATGDSLITSGKTTGTAVRLRGIYSTQAKQWGVVLGDDDATVSATGGGDVVIEASDATAGLDTAISLSRATVTASAGGRVQIKSTGRIELGASVIQTAGPSSTRTGAISIWSDSDGNDVGHFLSAGTLCLNTIGSCVTPVATGGSDIYLGGGSLADSTGFFPSGGAPSSDSYYGIRFSDGRSLDRTKIWSGSGDISIASKTYSMASNLHGQFWYGGTHVNSGNGQIRVTNYSGGATTNAAYGIFVEANSYRSLITSSKPSGDAIRIVSSLAHSGDYSNPIIFWDGSDSIRNSVSATGGGSIYMEGNASGTGTNTYSFDLSNLDLTATTGNIFLKGNRGAWFNRVNNGQTNIGATATGSASGNISFEGNRFSSYTTALALRFKTSGVLTIRPSNGESFADTVAFPRSEISLLGLSGLTVGGVGNTATINTGAPAAASTSIAGNVSMIGGVISNGYALATTNAGNMTFTTSGAFTNSAALTAAGTISANAAVFTNTATLTATNKDITISADQATIGAAINSGSAITTLTGKTAARPIDLGAADSATLLGLTDTELDLITAGIIRVGDATSGNVNVSSPITIASAKSTTLAIRSGRDVGKTGTGSIVVANLGIDAVGTITMGGGHSVSGNLALNGSGATFSQTSMSYTPNTVDTIAASFGTGDVLSVTAIPEVNGTASDQFMAVTFNPPPVATVKDKYLNTLADMNTLKSAYKVTVTSSGPGILEGTKTIDAAVGVATFSDLKITGSSGNHVLNFALAPRSGTATFGTANVSSGTYNVQAGDPNNLNVLTAASSGTSDAAFSVQPVIQIRDIANNLVVQDPGKSAVVTATVSAGGTIVGSETATAVNSVATFADLGIKGLISENYTITYSIVFGTSTISKAQSGITIASGVATTLEVAQPPSVSNAAVFATQPVVTAKDSAGNTATTQVGTVTVANGSLTGTKTKALVDGVASFAGQDLKLTGTISTYPLTYTMGALSTISGVQLTHGVATQLDLTTPAAGFVNRAVFDTAPVITVLDVSGNPVLNSVAQVTIESTTAALSGTFTMPAVDGIANFANKGLKLTGTAVAQVLTYKATNLTSDSQSFDLLHGAAYELRLVTDGAGAKSGIKFTTSPRVEILDQDANLVNSGTSAGASITASISGAAYNSVAHTGVELLGTVSLDAVAGVATFSNLRLEGVAGSYTLTFSATAPAAVSSFTDSQTIALLAGTATKLRPVAQPAGIVAGVAFGSTVTVEILDAYNNRVLVVANAITPTLIDTASTPNTIETKTAVAAANGLSTFTGLTFTKAGAHKIVFSATDLTSTTSNEFAITNAAPHHLTWVTQPTGAKNGVALSSAPVLEVRDEFENPALVGATTTVAASIQPANTDVISVSGASASSNDSARVTFANLVLKAKAGNYGLRFTATNGTLPINGTHIDTSSTVAIAQGDPENLNVLTPASGGTSDAAFTTQPVIQIRDSANNLVSAEPGKSAVVTATISAGGTRVGSATATASNSVATFAGLGIKGLVSGSYTITYSIEFNSTTISKDQTGITIGSGVATVLEVVQPAEVSNAVVFATQPVVTAKDSAGNVATTQVGSVAVANGNLTGTKTKALVAGVANFAGQDLKLTGTIGTYPLTYTMGSLTTISSVTLKHGVATKLELTTPAAGFVNRENFSTQPVIAVQDESGNRVLDSAVAVEVSIGSATLTGLTTVNALNGLATFSDLGKFGAVGSKTLTFKATGLADATQTFLLTHGAATKLDLTTVASSAKAGIVFGGQPVVRVLDADDNLVNTGDNASATIAVSTLAAAYNAANHTGADLLGTLSAQASAGVATFAGLHIDGVAATYSLSYSATAPAAITGFTAVTQNLAVAAGTKTALRTVAQPTDVVAGVAFGATVTVEILDAFNNRVLVATNDITPTLIDTALVPATVDATKTAVTAVDGLATFTGLTFTKAGSHKVLFTATNLPGADLTSATSSAFTITNAAPHHLTWVTQPTGAKNDVALSPAPVLEVRDEFENPALTGDATTVAATIQPANTDVLTVSGATATSNTRARVTFSSLTLQAKIGNYGLRFTATNGSLPINGTHIDTTSTVAITHGDPTQLVITTPAAAAKAGFAFGTQPVVEVRDSAGNRVSDSALTVTASMTNREIIGTATAVASSGVATFTNLGLNGASATGLQLNFKTTFSSAEIATSQLINLSAGAAIEVVMTQQPATVKTRDVFAIAPSVTLLDLWQNPVLSDNETQVTAQLIDSSGTPIGNKSTPVTAVGGTATFSTLAFTATPASGYRIEFEMESAGDTVTSDAFTINPGTATKLLITTQPATLELNGSKTKTGELLATQPVAKLYDQDDNLVTTANSGSATVSIGSGVGASLSEGSTTANFVGGIATFSGVKLVGTPNASYTLEFASSTPNPALTSAASNAISVMHNDAHHLVLTEAAATGRAGDIFATQPQVTIQDRYSNTVTTGTGAGLTVRASAEITAPNAGAATLIGATQKNAIAGVATFGSLGIGGSTANTYKINFSISSSSVVAASQSDIQITYGYSDRVVMVTQPVGGNATGDALATQPVVAVQDAYGNLVADAADTVTASIVSTAGLTLADASVARLTGESVNAQNGTATFTALKLFGLPTTNYVLQFTIGQNPATANAISVTHAAAHHATIVTQPVGGNATGANLAGQPVVELRDQFENIVTSNSTDVLTATLASAAGTNLAGGSNDPERLAGSTTAVFSAGVATFAGLKVIALPETLYTLNFDATVGVAPIASATSTTFGVTYSTATKLAVFQQPEANVTGTLLTTQPIIEVQDIYGNRVRNYAGMVAVTLPQANSTLSNSTYAGTATQFEAVIADGRATFGGLEITAIPGTDYQLNFALSPLTSINSGNLRVVAAAPFEVLMVTQPVGAQTNATLSGQPVVRVVDRFGNTVLSDSSTVITASIADGIGGVLSRVANGNAQPLAVTVANGVGTFDNLIFRGVSLRDYKLKFEATGLTAATSNTFSVTHADASILAITTQPVSGATGLALTTQPVLELRDFDENLAITDSSSVVTASITSGAGGTLANATATASLGVVSFTNLTLTGTPGVAYQITFTGNLGVLGSVTSVPSGNITPLHGAPNQLAMRGTAVVGGLVGEDLVAQPKLNVLDSFGNLATTDNLTVVTASILADTTGAVLGTTTATAVNGLVDFSGLKATGTPGTAYTLIFSATSSGTTLATANSNTFTLSKQAAVSLSYVAQAYAPDAIVAPVFATDSRVSGTNSTGLVTYSTTTEAEICTLNTTTGQITIKGAGTCSVNVSVAATEFYLANSVDADLEIAKARQTLITITSAATINYWGTVYPAATGGSGDGIMTFAVNGDCKLVANTVIPGDAGSRCRLTATVPGDENYMPEASATQTIRVLKIDQAPLMMASASDLKVGTLTLVAAGGSGTGALTYGVVTTNLSNSANCSIVGAVLTATTNGVCSVRASKAASTNYNAVETSIQLITVSKQEQSVAFTSTVPMFPVALGSYTPTASASSALAVGFTLVTDAQNPACQFDPLNRAKVVFLIAGECEIVATQAGNSVFSSAAASQVIQVGILNQSIVFAAITDKPFGTPGFMVSASSNSGLPVTLATTSNSNACTLSNNGLIALTGAGLCEISATQAGNLTYGPASAVIRSFNVLADFAGAPQIISVSSASQAFTASFTAPSYTGGSPILGYKLMLTDVNGEVYTNSACALIGSPLTCTVVGLPNDIAYTAKVAAVTVAGIGSFSSSSIAQTPLEAPLAVNNLAAVPAAGNLVVNWDVPTVSDDVFLSEFVSYQVYVAPIGTAFPALPSATILQANATSATISLAASAPIDGAFVRSASFGRASFSRAAVSTPTPTPSPTPSSIAGYNIRVVTVTTAAAVSTNDNTTNGVQIGFAVPFAPAQMILDPITTSLWISWSAPTADGGQPVLNYDVRVNGELVCPATTNLECTYLGMTAGTTYNVEVFARSAVGLSPAAFDSYSVPAPPAVIAPPVVIPSPDATSPAPVVPTVKPTVRPTVRPTVKPTVRPTVKPTAEPTTGPIAEPGAAIENDIDGDGIINNEDSDIDGDGIANGLDDDIDGDGKPNFDDGDPAGTNGGGNQAPEKPASPILQPLSDGGAWLFIPALVLAFIGGLFALRKKRKSS